MALDSAVIDIKPRYIGERNGRTGLLYRHKVSGGRAGHEHLVLNESPAWLILLYDFGNPGFWWGLSLCGSDNSELYSARILEGED